MPDKTDHMLQHLLAHRLPNIDLGDDFVFPYYQGRSILNIPSSISKLLGAPDFGEQPLIPEILDPLGQNIQTVIFILMDALALHRLQRWMSDGLVPVWNNLLQDGLLAPLTSITPSTTSAALTTLWTGRPAAWHAITGYEMWLKEYGLVANMIEHKPISYFRADANLKNAGFNLESFLPQKESEQQTLGSHLSESGIQTHVFQHQSIARSGLTRMLMKDAHIHPFKSLSDLWISVRQLQETNNRDKKYIWVYWGAVDNLSHHMGPDDERTIAEFENFSAVMEKLFLNSLTPESRKNTLLILGADHGQIATRKDPHYDLKNHPNLSRRLHMNPTGENRLAYLYIRPGQTEAVREYIDRTWPNQFVVLESQLALHNGLFGSGQPHTNMHNRIGDLILIAKGQSYLWWGPTQNPLIGRHGGLSAEEMLVPFLAARLG